MDCDAIIIGGSYAGLSAAMQLARARRNVCVIDAGEPRNRFAAASHGFFGQDGAQPSTMIAQARTQLLAYPSVTVIEGHATAARQDAEERFSVDLASGETLTSSRIVLAHGVTDVLPGIPGVSQRWGVSVLHCPYCHGYEYGGRQLGVLNTLPVSAHQATLIPEWGPTTYFLNGEELLDDAVREALRQRDVVIEPARVVGLEGEGTSLSGVRLVDGRLVPVEALFLSPTVQLQPFAAQLGCELDEGPFGPLIRTDAIKMTTVPGVYAAGDAAAAAANATLASADGVFAGASLHRSLMLGSAR
jgi:thioredoxin reductase